LQNVLGYSPLEAGVRLLPQAALLLIVAPLSPRLVEKVGTKIVVGVGLLLAAGGLVYVSQLPVTDGYPKLLAGLVVTAIGMALVMAPATESIMGSLPKSKAGVGSAMNDTTRQMGGALGVAVIGSLFASAYRPGVADKIAAAGAPPSVVHAARDSLGSALEAARTLPGPLAAHVADISRNAFVDALGPAMLLAAGVLLVAAGIVFAFLPARARDHAAATSGTGAAPDAAGVAPEPVPDAVVEEPAEAWASLASARAEGMLEESFGGIGE
jgi:MFS family permease